MKQEETAGKSRPQIGQFIKVYNLICRIVKIHPFGTIDVVSLDGNRSYRVTGLPFI